MANSLVAISCCIAATALLLLACSHVQASHTCFGLEGAIRLADGPNSREGRVDICRDIVWYTPCQEGWGIEETHVVCRQLGFCQQGGQVTSGENYHDNIPFTVIQVNCTGGEDSLSQCLVDYSGANCPQFSGAGVSCYSTPRRPTNIELTAIDQYSILVSWSAPDMSNCTDVEEYIVGCNDYENFNFFTTVPGHSLNVTIVHDVDINRRYYSGIFSCTVQGNNSAGRGSSVYGRGPKPSPLRDVSAAEVTPTSLLIEWIRPEFSYGGFDFYYIVCGTQGNYVFNISHTTANVTGLSVFTRYECCVRVYTFRDIVLSCVNITTAPVFPTAPLGVNVTMVTATLVQLEWSRPQPVNGIISHYTATCSQSEGSTVRLETTVSESATVSNLRAFSYYTCCVSATNQAGEGNETCVETRTNEAGPPTEPEQVATVTLLPTSLMLTWSEPIDSSGQPVLFYSINCTSPTHTVEVERVYDTTVTVSGLTPHSNYTCCVSATSSVGVGQEECVLATTNDVSVGSEAGVQLVAAVSGGVLSSVLLLLVVVAISIVCCCCKRRTTKQCTLQNHKSTADPVYEVPEEIELNHEVNTSRNAVQHSERSHRQEYKEEVEMRYEKPVLTSNVTTTTNTRTKKPLAPPNHTSHETPSNQTGDERIYQPLVPPKTYKGPQETSAYQDLAFETREPEGGVVNNSEGQYEVIQQREEVSAYQPLSFGEGGREEGAYQPLTFQGEEPSIYQQPNTTSA